MLIYQRVISESCSVKVVRTDWGYFFTIGSNKNNLPEGDLQFKLEFDSDDDCIEFVDNILQTSKEN